MVILKLVVTNITKNTKQLFYNIDMANLYPEVEILNINSAIEENIEFLIDNRQLMSYNILQTLRTLTEDVALMTYNKRENCKLDGFYDNKKKAIKYIEQFPEFKSTSKLYKYLEASASHYAPNDTNSERLLLKYYYLLVDIKDYVYKEFRIKILEKLSLYPLNTDKTFSDYYDKVAQKIEEVGIYGSLNYIKGRYYIERIKPFKSNGNIYYEITLTKAIDNPSKFDRIIAFTKYRMIDNYSVKVSFANAKINIFDGEVSIKIINNWTVSIRPCEIYNFAKIFGDKYTLSANSHEYKVLMNYLTSNEIDLLDVLNLSSDNFNELLLKIKNNKDSSHIDKLLNDIREITKENKYGSNIIRYLLYRLRNRVIKSQLSENENYKISNLHLQNGCMMFEDMPVYMSPLNHVPDIDDIIMSIDCVDKEEEFLARTIKDNTEFNNKLYTPIQELENFSDLKTLAEKLESRLYITAKNSRVIIENGYAYIKEYEDKTLGILKSLLRLSNSGISDYDNQTKLMLSMSTDKIYPNNIEHINELFSKSKVAIVYGSAGTGKTTFIGDYSRTYQMEKSALLSNTHAAIENLKRRVKNNPNYCFRVIKSFIAKSSEYLDYSLLVIDESSTVENKDMFDVLSKSNFEKLLIVGDTCQIGSVCYGNWFSLACDIMPDYAKHYLSETRRTTNENLLEFWKNVRNGSDKITEFLSKTDFVSDINNSISKTYSEDEITLCLNYNGLYGINNINKYMQDNNNNKGIEIGINTYKINDPVIFEDNKRYKNSLYNNLKGWIRNIEDLGYETCFTIEIDDKLDKQVAISEGIEVLEYYDNNHTLISFCVKTFDDSDGDDNELSDDIVPFNVSYAISIHKAQGLEYNSVKIIISNDVQELITKDVFYTAITRAKEQLHIFWTSETQEYIVRNLENSETNIDLKTVKSKLLIP